MASEPVPLSGLARRLVEENILDADAAFKASEEARKQGTPFVTYLVQTGLAEARTIAISASEEFGVPLIDLSAFDLESIPRDLVKENLIRQHSALGRRERPSWRGPTPRPISSPRPHSRQRNPRRPWS